MAFSNWIDPKNIIGNYSNNQNDTFDPKNNYLGIRLQQGVPLLDRDWNELEDIRRYQELSLRQKYIGDGTPDDGYKIDPSGGKNFTISGGTYLVGGFEVMVGNTDYTTLLNSNPPMAYPLPGGVISPITHLPLPYDGPAVIYLDVWIDETSIDGKNYLDVKQETCKRHTVMWKIGISIDINFINSRKPMDKYHHYAQLATIDYSTKNGISNIVDSRTKIIPLNQINNLNYLDSDLEIKGSLTVDKDTFAKGNLSVSGNVGIGTLNPRAALEVNVNAPTNVGVNSTLALFAIANSNGAGDVYGLDASSKGAGENVYGVFAIADHTAAGNVYGVQASAHNTSGIGNVYGLYAQAAIGPNSYAGYFDGNVNITGGLSITGNVGIGMNNPKNLIETIGAIQYSSESGKAWQSGDNIVNCDPSIVSTDGIERSILVFNDGTTTHITGFDKSKPNQIAVADSKTVEKQGFTIYYPGLNVKSDGNVGIGTTQPNVKLEIVSDDEGKGDVLLNGRFKSVSHHGGGMFVDNDEKYFVGSLGTSFETNGIGFNADNQWVLVVQYDDNQTNGKVGINNNNPSCALDVNGSIAAGRLNITGNIGVVGGEGNNMSSQVFGVNVSESYMESYTSPVVIHKANYALYASAIKSTDPLTINYAGWFEGDVTICGGAFNVISSVNVTGSKNFLIDHPLDPKHKTLRHSSVESPENLCLYRGKVTLDSTGKAIVKMPDYFAALTKEEEATVYLTSIGGKPFLTSYEWNKNSTAFTVFGQPKGEVTYIVLADRDDPAIRHLRRPVEEEKGNGHFTKGKHLLPEAYGLKREVRMPPHTTVPPAAKPAGNAAPQADKPPIHPAQEHDAKGATVAKASTKIVSKGVLKDTHKKEHAGTNDKKAKNVSKPGLKKK